VPVTNRPSYREVVMSSPRVSRWALRLDGIFLALAGGAALVAETLGHFLGVGPLAATRGSPHTIGGVEAHGLAIILAVLLLRASGLADRRLWHGVGLSTHLLLSSANILFWSSFVQQGVVPVGIVTTALQIAFVAAHATCLRRPAGTVPAAA
jgi:hypothetical protein